MATQRLLTDKGAERLKVRRKTYVVEDAGATGLGLKVTRGGRRVWVLHLRYPGQTSQSRRRLGDFAPPDYGVVWAREKARAWYAAVKDGIDPVVAEEKERQAREAAQRAEALKDRSTFSGFSEKWIAKRTNKRAAEDGAEIRRHLIPAWGNRPIGSITPRDVRELFETLTRDTPWGARSAWGHMTSIFAAAEFEELIAKSPVSPGAKRLIFKNVKLAHRQRVLSDDELFALWRACGRVRVYRPVREKGRVKAWDIDANTAAPVGAFYRLSLLTACRRTELSEARWTELHSTMRSLIRKAVETGQPVNWEAVPPEAKTLTVPEARFKAGTVHIVPLVDEACRIIENLPVVRVRLRLSSTKDFFLFSLDGEAAVWLGSKWKNRIDDKMTATLRALARRRGDDAAAVKLPHWIGHDLRRNVRSGLSALGVADHVAEATIGHGRKGIARVYDMHGYQPEIREALELWAAKLRSIVEPTPPPKRNNVVPMKGRGRAR